MQGVLDKLDYLQALGINAIYFNPLFESPSLHKYDGATYHHIDDNFGPDPARDRKLIGTEVPNDPHTWVWTTADSLFLVLVKDCHNRHIKVILDGVFNHVGLNFWAFQDVLKRQKKSKFANWFTIKQWDDPRTVENEFDYEGWAGVKELPEIREDQEGPVPEAREYIFSAVKRWMDPDGDGDPSDGIDGWRLDVAEKVGKPFWRKFRKLVKSLNPEAYLVGEVWWQDWPRNKMFDASPWLQGDLFDAVMNYRWAKEVVHFFVDHNNKITVTEFDTRLRKLRENYPAEVNYCLMNLLDSHDTDRIASQIVNPDGDYDHADTPRDDPEYKIRKPNRAEVQIQKLVALFQMTYLGAPMIYYGDEAGMWGADDPDCRKPMLWPEFSYAVESSHPFGKPRPADANEFNHDLFEHYQKLIAIRQEHAALQLGEIATVVTDDAKDVYVFKRFTESETVIVALNNSNRSQSVLIPTQPIGGRAGWRDLLTGKPFKAKDGALTVTMGQKSGYILAQNPKPGDKAAQ